jgi:tetratricopeptide (TPR) repeat protein
VGQRRKELTPKESPAHLLGWKLRMWRDRRHLTLRQLGALVHVDYSYLGRIEAAERPPTREIIVACDKALATGGELEHLWPVVEQHLATTRGVAKRDPRHVASSATHVVGDAADLAGGATRQASSEEEGVLLPHLIDGRIVFMSVPRRQFLGTGLGALATFAISNSVSEASAAPSHGTSASAALEAGASPIEHITQVRRKLIDRDNLLGPRAVIGEAQAQIHLLQELRLQASGTDRRSLLHLQAEMAETCGWFCQDAGDFRAAQYWTDRALEWSHGTGDQEMAAYVLARKAQLAGDSGDALTAADMGDAAQNLATPGTRLLLAAQIYGAHGLALRGDTEDALRVYGTALEAVDKAAAGPPSQWAPWLDRPYIEVQEARSLSVLGRHDRAAEVFQAAIRRLPPSYRRDRGVYLGRQAVAHAGAGEPEQAAVVGLDALAIATQTRSGRILTELARLDQLLAPHASQPCVAQFRAELDAVVVRSTQH